MSASPRPARPGGWERLCSLLFRLYPPGYRRRHDTPRRRLMAELLDAETDPHRRGRRARQFALDAARTLPRVWWRQAIAASDGVRAPNAMLSELPRNLRFAVRALASRPGFTAVAILTLAIGIGATTAIFSVVRSVLLRPLPYDAPERIVQVWNPWSNEPGVERGRSSISSLDFLEIREAVGGFEHVAAYVPPLELNLTGGDRPERVVVAQTTAQVFDVLGARTALGRTYTAEDAAAGRHDEVVLSHGLWQRRFGGDPSVLGSAIQLDGVVHAVIGVLSPSFRLPADYAAGRATELWKPLALDPATADRANQWLHVLARLGPGATLATANAELEALTRSWIEQGFKVADLGPYYGAPIADELFGDIRPALLILLGAVGFVLLIACVNVANLLLARADERRREMAVRAALGATRPRILAQLLAEGAVLATAGAALGLLLAYSGAEALTALEPANIPRVAEVRIDLATLGFTAAIAFTTAVVFGLVPMFQAAGFDLIRGLKGDARTATGGHRARRVRGLLVTGEVALSVVLVIGAALMIRTFVELSRIDLGFDPGGVVAFEVSLPLEQYAEPDARVRFHAELTRRLEESQAVVAAGAASTLPLTGRLGGGSIEVEGAPSPRPGEGLPNARWQIVTPGYFAALRHTRSAGRLLEPSDRADAVPVVVVNETAAETLWPGQSAVGKRLRNTNSGVPWFTVVGVVHDVRQSGVVDTPSPTVYFPLEQFALTRTFGPAAMAFVVRTGSPRAFAGIAREAVRALDPDLPLSGVRTMDDVVADALAQARFTMLLLAIFATVALALAAVGIYGLLSFAVSRQKREIGIRVALGASTGSVRRLVIRQGMRLTMIGLGAGLAAAVALTRLAESQLYGVQPLDPATFLVVPALFAVVALAATYLPARRATSVDPIMTLRDE